MQLTGKVALITGAGSGIGKAAAILLAKEGAKVGALGRTESQLQQVVDEIKGNGGEALLLLADVSDPVQVEKAVERTVQKWGRLDIVFANAGINGMVALVDEISPEEYDRTMDINMKGTFLTVKYSVPYLRKQGGSIIIDSSVNGNRMFSNIGRSVYSASKAAQVAFTKSIAMELGRDRIRVNAICPGWISTEIGDNTYMLRPESVRKPVVYPEGFIPLTGGKPGTPEQVAKLVLFLASDESNHISGTEIYIDGAESLIEG